MPSYKLMSLFKPRGRGVGRCGCGPKESDVVEPIPKSKASSFSHQKPNHTSDTSSDIRGGGNSDAAGDNTFSVKTYASPSAAPCCQKHATYPKTVSAAACPKIHDCVAVVKDSDDPYRDFRRSMLRMILEKKIYSRDDLRQLLDCVLKLNSPLHHEVIVRAFVDICNCGGDAAANVSPVVAGGAAVVVVVAM